MRYIVYCKKCGFLGADEETNRSACLRCGTVVTMTNVTEEQWKTKTKEEKDALKLEWNVPKPDNSMPVAAKQVQTDAYEEPAESTIGKIIKSIALIILCFSVIGSISWMVITGDMLIGFIMLVGSLLACFLCYGFGEICCILYDIRAEMKKGNMKE